jgi:hypothetical protein
MIGRCLCAITYALADRRLAVGRMTHGRVPEASARRGLSADYKKNTTVTITNSGNRIPPL